MRESQQNAFESVDHILNKGASILYDSYLQTKLPNHTYQLTHPQYYATLEPAHFKSFPPQRLAKAFQPNPLYRDSLLKNKILVKKASTIEIKISQKEKNKELQNNMKKVSRVTKPDSKSSSTIKSTPKGSKPFVKLLEYKNKGAKKDAQLLKELISRRAEEKRKKRLEEDELALEQKRKKSNIEKYKHLKSQNNIVFNFDGKVFSGKSKKPQICSDDCLKLDYLTTQNCWEYTPGREGLQSQVTGRKRGYTSCERRTRIRMSDEQFNNGHMRQMSSIPFMLVENGSKLTEKEKDVFVEKVGEFRNKEDFDKQIEKTGFISYSTGRKEPEMRATMSSRGRNEKYSTVNTIPISKTGTFFRTRASHKSGWIKINDEDLAKQMCINPENPSFFN